MSIIFFSPFLFLPSATHTPAHSSLAIRYPYVLAFDPSFIEVRHVETGALEQVIPMGSLRSLSTHTDAIHGVATQVLPGPNPVLSEYQHIFQMVCLKEGTPSLPPAKMVQEPSTPTSSNPGNGGSGVLSRAMSTNRFTRNRGGR